VALGPSAKSSQRAVALYVEQLMQRPAAELRGLMPCSEGDLGTWPVPALDDVCDGIALDVAGTWRSDRLLLVVQPRPRRGWYRVIADGVAVSSESVSSMNDEDWAYLG
jgi:hypothetical protein